LPLVAFSYDAADVMARAQRGAAMGGIDESRRLGLALENLEV